MNADLIFGFLVYLLILIVIFLLLRQVMCWYWKININIGLQEEQIQLQKETIKLLEKLVNPKKDLTIIDVKTDNTKEAKQVKDPKTFSNEEIEVINSKISLLKENEIIVIHSLSRVIKRIHMSEFDESRGWIIVKEFEK